MGSNMILIAVVVSVFCAVISWIAAQRAIYINTISASRIKWISGLREDLASLISLADDIFVYNNSDVNNLREFSKLITRVRLRLNPKGDQETIEKLKMLQEALWPDNREKGLGNYKGDRESLISDIQMLLKAEWDKAEEETSHIFVKMHRKSKINCR